MYEKTVSREASVKQATHEIHYNPESRTRTFHASARLIHSAHRIHVYVAYWNSNKKNLNFHNCSNISSMGAHARLCNEKEIKAGLEAPTGLAKASSSHINFCTNPLSEILLRSHFDESSEYEICREIYVHIHSERW